nr:reverse transcriptase domain-containing protein [Tanacetum cinerariifolium]
MSIKEYERRHRSRRSRSPRPSVFSGIKHDRSRLSRQNSREKEGCVFKRLGNRGKSVSTHSDSHNWHSYSRYTEAFLKNEDSGGGHWKSRSKKKKSSREEDDLSQPWKKCIKDLIEIHNIKQRDGESTKDFVKRYKLESRDVKGAPECMRISEFMHGITNPELIKRLHDKILKTVNEMMRVTTSFLRGKWQLRIMNEKIHFHHGNNKRVIISKTSRKKGSETSQGRKERVARQKITQTFSPNSEIFFPPLGEDEGIEVPIIIEAEIEVPIYVDDGLASEILYEYCFNRLRSEIKNQLMPTFTPLIRFSGEIIWPIEKIQLLVKIGDEEHSTAACMNFVVVRSPSTYNGIIGRPGVKKLQAVSSTAHGMLKLAVEEGVITLKSSRLVSLECAMVSGPPRNLSTTKKIVKQRVNVAINLEYLEQTVMIDSTLSEEGRNKLCNLLHHNLDIFADMTDVPRHIAEHRLNIQEGCHLVRQKKRGQAVDKNQAIQGEVGKLVKAGIMKEVHYHDWLSNPVMVKKHDGSWRMCVDFKDLNKACPKDGYPLPEIDWKMPFGLRNARVTYQRLVDKAFHKQIGRNLEVYVDELVIKSRTEDEIVMEREKVIVYLAAAKRVSVVLMTEREAKQMPIYFVSRALRGPEINYTSMEKLVMALVHTSTCLKRYFQAHPIIVITDQPIQQVLSRPKVAGRLQKWSIELGEYAIHYRPRVSVKRQILANFIVERPEKDSPDTLMETEEEIPEPWILFTDGSFCTDGSRAGLILTKAEGMEFTYALRFRFDATNNEAEYEALIAGLRTAKWVLKIFRQMLIHDWWPTK